MSDNFLSVSENDILTIAETDYFSVGTLLNTGEIGGLGTIGLDWSEPIQGDSDGVTVSIAEENIPDLLAEITASTRSITVFCFDIGAETYYSTLDEEPETELSDERTVVYRGLEPSSVHSVELRAVNSRSDEITRSFEITLDAVFGVYDVSQEVYTQPEQTHRSNAVFLARLVDKDSGLPLTASDVQSIRLRAWKFKRNTNGISRESVDGFENIDVPVDAVLMEMESSDYWTIDSGKVNFIHIPDQRNYPLFPTPGSYLLEYEILLKDGNPINLHYEIYVY